MLTAVHSRLRHPDPAKVQALKDRVDIEFAPTARAYFGADEPVAVDVDVKNVKTLIVKVFELRGKGAAV